jgi:hypothetical protein
MSRATKFLIIAAGILLLGLTTVLFFLQIGPCQAKPPASVTDLHSFFAWMPKPVNARRVTLDNTLYYTVTGEWVGFLPSGSTAYSFDAQGKFIGWTPDEGDLHVPDQVYAPGVQWEYIPVDELKTRFDPATRQPLPH